MVTNKTTKKAASRSKTVDAKMPAMTHHPKATKKHHHKPYRKRHFGLLGFATLVLFVSVVMFLAGKLSETLLFSGSSSDSNTSSFTVVKSNYGIGLSVDLNLFDVTATEVLEDGEIATVGDLSTRDSKSINSVVVKPRAKTVEPRYGASSVSLGVDASTSTLTNARKNVDYKDFTDNEIAAKLHEVKSDANFSVEKISQTEDTLDGVKVVKTVYQHTVKSISLLDGVHTYSIHWTGVLKDRTFVFSINGLINGSEVPYIYLPLIDSISIANDVAGVFRSETNEVATSNVLGETILNESFIADLISPSVVKVYSGICGDLRFDSTVIFEEYCGGGSGSGFLLSNDGYIATNGHVVVHEPTDALVELMLYYPNFLEDWMTFLGFTSYQIDLAYYSTDVLIALIASTYEAQEEDPRLNFSNKEEKISIALGETPVNFDSSEEYFADQTSKDIVSAEIVDYDYKYSDFFNDVEEGFTANDVALLKADLNNAPAMKLFSGTINTNQSLMLLGFPGDAENALVDNKKIAVTVSNGTVNSIRETNGGLSTVYQSDVDASHGNSGGPAVTADGEVFGILTYVYQSASSEDSAKTYIRDISDLTTLLTDNSVVLDTESETTNTWKKGLELFSTNRFSKSIKDFEKVKELYPAHRLADRYIGIAEEEILAGNDVKDFPIILVSGIVAGLAGVGLAVFFIMRHRKHHENFKRVEQHNVAAGYSPSNPTVTNLQPVPQPTTMPATPPPVQAPTQVLQQPGSVVTPSQPQSNDTQQDSSQQ